MFNGIEYYGRQVRNCFSEEPCPGTDRFDSEVAIRKCSRKNPLVYSEAYSEHYQTSNVELFVKTVTG